MLPIEKILPSDIISKSIEKINKNFDIISNTEDFGQFKMDQFKESIDLKLSNISGSVEEIDTLVLNLLN